MDKHVLICVVFLQIWLYTFVIELLDPIRTVLIALRLIMFARFLVGNLWLEIESSLHNGTS